MDVKKKREFKKNTIKSRCCVRNCNSVKGGAYSLHKIPFAVLHSPEENNKWKQQLKIGGSLNQQHVCSKHFEPEDIVKSKNENDKLFLKKGAVPSLHLPKSFWRQNRLAKPGSSSKSTSSDEHFLTDSKDASFDSEHNFTVDGDLEINPVDHVETQKTKTASVGTQTKMLITQLWDTNQKLHTMTGLPTWAFLDGLADHYSKNCKIDNEMSIRNRILLTFNKLKTNGSFAEIAVGFQTTHESASQYFIDGIEMLATLLNGCVNIPKESINRRKLPVDYKQAETPVVISTDLKTVAYNCRKCNLCKHVKSKRTHDMQVLLAVTQSGFIESVDKAFVVVSAEQKLERMREFFMKVNSVGTNETLTIKNEPDNIVVINPRDFQRMYCRENDELLLNYGSAQNTISSLNQFKILAQDISIGIIPHLDTIFTIICSISNLTCKRFTR